jgi:hypothetical protein
MVVVTREESQQKIRKLLESWGLPPDLINYITDIDISIGVDCIAVGTISLLLHDTNFDFVFRPDIHYDINLPVGFEMIDSVTDAGDRRIRVEKVEKLENA